MEIRGVLAQIKREDTAFILFVSSKEPIIQSTVEFIFSIHARKHVCCVNCSSVEVQTTNLNIHYGTGLMLNCLIKSEKREQSWPSG